MTRPATGSSVTTAGGISDGVRAVIAAAEDHARELGHHAIAPAHLLLGLLAEETERSTSSTSDGLDGPGLFVGRELALAVVRDAVVRHADTTLLAVHRPGDHPLRGGWGRPTLPVSPQGRGALQQALRRATPPQGPTPWQPGQRQLITPAHVLLGLLDGSDAVTRRILTEIVADLAGLARDARRIAGAAPMLERPAPQSSATVAVRVRDDGRAVFSLFGWPSRLRTDGPAARRVLARGDQTGQIDIAELHAAAESDAQDAAADRARHDDPDDAR